MRVKVVYLLNVICILLSCVSLYICFDTNAEIRRFKQETNAIINKTDNLVNENVDENSDTQEKASSWTILGPADYEDFVLKVIYNSKEESEYFTYGTEYCVKEIQVVECSAGTEYFYLIPLEINMENKQGVHTLYVQGKEGDFFVSDSGI